MRAYSVGCEHFDVVVARLALCITCRILSVSRKLEAGTTETGRKEIQYLWDVVGESKC